MPEELSMQKRAKAIIELAQIGKGDKVLILCDHRTAPVGELLVAQVAHLEAVPIFTSIPPLKAHGDSVPEPVAKMALDVDVIIAPMMVSIAHTPLRYEALKRGIKLIVLAQVDEALLSKSAFDVDFHELKPRIEKLGELVDKAKTAKVSNAKGTNITLNIDGRGAQAFTGFLDKSKLSAPPALEVNCSPVEGTAQGKIVADVAIDDMPPHLSFLGLLKETVEVTVKDGFARQITGGQEAGKFKEFLASLHDPNIYNIAELGIGMNPVAKADGTNLMNEGSQDNIHIALGTNIYFPGGTVEAKGHFDLVMSFCTLELDGIVVIKEGRPIF